MSCGYLLGVGIFVVAICGYLLCVRILVVSCGHLLCVRILVVVSVAEKFHHWLKYINNNMSHVNILLSGLAGFSHTGLYQVVNTSKTCPHKGSIYYPTLQFLGICSGSL